MAAAAVDDDDGAEAGAATRRRSGAVPCFGACFGGGWPEEGGADPGGARSRYASKTSKKKKGNKKKGMGRSPSSSSSVSWWRLIRWSKAYPGWKSQRTVRPVDASPAAVDAVEEEVKEEEAVVKTAEPRRVSCYQERVAAALTEHGGGGERGRKAKCRATRLSANEAQKPAETPKHATCRRSASFAPWKPAPPAYPDPRKPVRSVSFPAPGGKRKLHPGAAAGAGNSGDLDPVVGMSVLIVALVVLLLWGRLCAVFCTAAWFYFVPRLRKETRPPESRAGSGSSSPDKDSVEYKKKVVMEGLLERSHRSAAAIL